MEGRKSMAVCTPEKVNEVIDNEVMHKATYGKSFSFEKSFYTAEKEVDYFDNLIISACRSERKFNNKIYSVIMKSAWVSWKFACKYIANLDLYPSFAETLHQKWEIAKGAIVRW